VSDRRSEEIRIAEAVDLVSPELIGLATERNLHNPDVYLGDQSSGDHGARTTFRIVTVKHQ
jgi:hypothetical protein